MRRHMLLASVLLLAACTNACGAHGRGSSIPDALEQYEENFEVRRYTGVVIPGVELWQATPRNVCCDQESSIDVYGFDEQGRAVSSLELVRRLGDRTAADLVAPVSEILLHQPHRALVPGDPEVNDQFISAAERPLIAAPVLAEGVLTYFVLWGSMAPQFVRIRVTLATGEVVRDWDILEAP